MVRSIFYFILFVISLNRVAAQRPWSLSVFNHAAALPGGTWAGAFHPGFDLSLRTGVKNRPKSQTYFQHNLGYYYHRLVHHGTQLYSEYHWDANLMSRFGVGIAGGLGLLHTKEIHEIFTLENGEYQRIGRLGKLHGQASVAVKLWYLSQNKKIQPFVAYRFRLVSPFVKEYVPLLPAVSLHAGLAFNIEHLK